MVIYSQRNGPSSGDNNSDDRTCDLNAYFCEVAFNPISREGQRLLATIHNYLNQFHLNRLYKPEEILQETYLRCADAVQNRAAKIINHESYLKRVAYNYIRELQRKQQRELSREYVLETAEDESVEANPTSVLYYQQLQSHIDQLSGVDAELIRLRELERYPYKEVAQRLKDMNLGSYSPATLRKRKQRLIEELRKDSGWTHFL